MNKSETPITKGIIDWIIDHGGDAFHVHGGSFQRVGEPDIAGAIKWRGKNIHLKIEVKTPEVGREPSKIQAHRLDVYKGLGYCTGVVTSIDDLIEVLNIYWEEKYGVDKRTNYRYCIL